MKQDRGPGTEQQAGRGDPRGPTTPTAQPLPRPHSGLLLLASGASGFSREPALAPTAPEETAGPFLASWDDCEELPTPGAVGGPVLVVGLRVCGDMGCDALAGGLAPGPSNLGWELGTGAAAVGDLWGGTGVSRGGSPLDPQAVSSPSSP